jgi:cbb3-type cytochrome oxidase subunit 3
MLRSILENTEGNNVYAIIGLIFFILSFAGIVIWIFRINKNYISKMKNLPLEDDKTTGDNNEIK